MRQYLIVSAMLFFFSVSHANEQLALLEEKTAHSPANFEVTFDLANIANDKQIRLELDARIDGPLPGGSNPWMAIFVNDKSLTAASLINKPIEFTMRNGMDATWVTGQDWRIIIAPDFSNEIRTGPYPYGIPDIDPFHFVWDISPYVKKGTNTVRFMHKHLTAAGATLVLRNISVEIGEPIMPVASMQVIPAPIGEIPTYIVNDTTRPVDIKAELSSGGAIRFHIAKRLIEIKSRTSEPQGKWIETTPTKWSAISNNKVGNAQWCGTGYKVSRKLVIKADHIKVYDTFTNISDKVVGIIYENRLALPEKPMEILLAGRPVYTAEQTSDEPYHPSVMARWNDLTVGMVAEDDIFRVHIRAFCEPNSIGLADLRLGLAPEKSHTLEWSIYPVPNGDYWDFINAVRRNWGSNYTIPEPLLVNFEADGSKTADYYGKWTKARGIKLQNSNQPTFAHTEGPANHFAEGGDIMRAVTWCNGIKQWMQKLKSQVPDAKVTIYFHPEIIDDPNAQTLYADSKHLGANGEHLTSPYSYPVYLYLSTLKNSQGKARQKGIEFIVNDLGADGIFMDEFEPTDDKAWAYNTEWDQCTVEIDSKTHAVKRQYSNALLLGLPWKLWMINYLREHNKVLVANFPPATRTLLNMHVPRFREMNSYSFLIDTHLASPWGLGMPLKTDRAAMTRRYLDYAGIYTPYGWTDEPNASDFQFIPLMYPITPIELHAGMVLGKERILTNRSGKYGWPGNSKTDVYVIDTEGRQVKSPNVKDIVENEKSLIELRLASDQFAILVKKSK